MKLNYQTNQILHSVSIIMASLINSSKELENIKHIQVRKGAEFTILAEKMKIRKD